MPNEDLVSRQWLIDEYHRRHEGPPGGALKMIEEAPAADVEPKMDNMEELGIRNPDEAVRRDTLNWYTPALRPEMDERCILIPKAEDGAEEEVAIGRFSPGIGSHEADGFIVEHGAGTGVLFMEDVKLWAAWEWPDVKGGADNEGDPAD